mgnify:CR=1 FL=1
MEKPNYMFMIKNGKLVNTFSNIEDCTKNIYKDYGYFYTYNNKNGARLYCIFNRWIHD